MYNGYEISPENLQIPFKFDDTIAPAPAKPVAAHARTSSHTALGRNVSDNTVLNTRTYTFSFVWTPAGLGDYVAPIVAVGVDAVVADAVVGLGVARRSGDGFGHRVEEGCEPPRD